MTSKRDVLKAARPLVEEFRRNHGAHGLTPDQCVYCGIVQALNAYDAERAARKLHPHGGDSWFPHRHPGQTNTHAHPENWTPERRRRAARKPKRCTHQTCPVCLLERVK